VDSGSAEMNCVSRRCHLFDFSATFQLTEPASQRGIDLGVIPSDFDLRTLNDMKSARVDADHRRRLWSGLSLESESPPLLPFKGSRPQTDPSKSRRTAFDQCRSSGFCIGICGFRQAAAS